MTYMQFTTVILDADGVINDGTLLSLEKDFGITSDVMARFFRETFPACLVGKADMRAELAPYLAEWGWKGTIDELLHYWFSQGHKIHERVKDAVQRLRAAGVPVHLATNQEKLRVEYMRQEMGYGALFTALHPSCELGCVKPSQEFFAALHGRIYEPDKTKVLFWDDMEKNVLGAREYGFVAHRFTDEDSFVRKMGEYFPL
jgi:putative hydrolase of the HAD superfamily